MSHKSIDYNFFVTKLPSGSQVFIKYADQTAVITELGATLRSYQVSGTPIIWEFAESEMPSHSQGQILAPWPNRLKDGSYTFDGKTMRVPINELDNHNAIHGIFRWQRFKIEDIAENSCRLSFDSLYTPGYPYHLSLTVEYILSETGLIVNTNVVNIGSKKLPFAIGFHPYFIADSELINMCKLTIPAKQRLVMDERQIPISSESIIDTDFDFSHANKSRYIEDIKMDDCFFDLDLDSYSRWNVIFELSSGKKTALWGDKDFAYIMCYTGDGLGIDARRVLAIEPMTSPPNAFATGKNLIILEPSCSWNSSFGINPFFEN